MYLGGSRVTSLPLSHEQLEQMGVYSQMKARSIEVKKACGDESVKARITKVSELVGGMALALPDDAARIEIDIEYADGGRVKMEAKA